jgi:hypothetical protein
MIGIIGTLHTKGYSFQSPLYPGKDLNGNERLTRRKKHTIATDPQQRTVLLPLVEFVTLDEPCCRSFMLNVARGIMIDGGIRRREPFSKLLS